MPSRGYWRRDAAQPFLLSPLVMLDSQEPTALSERTPEPGKAHPGHAWMLARTDAVTWVFARSRARDEARIGSQP